MSANYTLGFVQRDGNMHDFAHYHADLAMALEGLGIKRAEANPHHIHWYVYDEDDPERGYFDHEDDAA